MQVKHTICVKGQLMDLDTPRVMGILNLTPDSFSDGGLFLEPGKALERAAQMLDEGAAILDLGAASSRPGAAEVSEQEELRRLMPVLESVLNRFPTAVISVDTWRASVAERALEAGAAIINDITGGLGDERMAQVVALGGAPLIVMHMQGTPQTMQQRPDYGDVVNDIAKFFSGRINALHLAGVKDIILDPGFGFGKTVEHNYIIAARFAEFGLFGLPLLAGVSRKRMLYELLNTTPADTVAGASALHMHLLRAGAQILRVHDVKEAVHCVGIYRAICG